MSKNLRFLPAGTSSFIVELDDLSSTIQLNDALSAAPLEGVKEIVPGARTLHVTYDPLMTSERQLYAEISAVEPEASTRRSGALVELPMLYDGEDLSYMAEYLGWSVEELKRRHANATFTVAFTGFAPGFAYMTCDDPDLVVPRRDSPRIRIPAGSVALAGSFCGVYPSDTPGGWQLIGTTQLSMWDVNRAQAAMLRPGDRVRFVEASDIQQAIPSDVDQSVAPAESALKALKVVSSDRPALYQDFGRPGNAHQGVSKSGAADLRALRDANELVGNAPGTAAIEVTYGGFSVLAEKHVTLAVAGAPAPANITAADGRVFGVATDMAIALNAGEMLTLGFPKTGVRTYIAIRGGVDVEHVMGSASTDTLAKIGPKPITAGDFILQGCATCEAVRGYPLTLPALPSSEDIIVLDVVMGPRTDWFTPGSRSAFFDQLWTVTQESNRVGVRLQGHVALTRDCLEELPSEGTLRGSIQVPRNGQPVLFMADHPLTGGYPVIAVVAEHHLSLAAQIPIGAHVRFNAIADFDPQVKEFIR